MWGRAPREPALSEAEGPSQAQRSAELLRMSAGWAPAGHGFERHFFSSTLRPSLPLQKQPRIILGDVIPRAYSQLLRSGINPAWCSLDLTEVPDRRLIHHDLAFPIGPLGAKLFVAERRRISQRAQDQIHLFPVVHASLQLDSIAMSTNLPFGFMRQSPRRAILADPQKFLASTQNFTGKIVQSINLVRSPCQQTKSSRSQPARQRMQVGDSKLNFDFALH
jgi:hypothetical protein